jgi:predicted ATPase
VRDELGGHRHAPTVASGTFFAVIYPEFLLGDFEACERHSAELVAYCVEKKVEQYRLLGAVCHTGARAMREPTRENTAAVRAAIDAKHRSGGRAVDSHFISSLAAAFLMAGDLAAAEAALREAFAIVEQSGEQHWLAELHRLKGQIALARPDPDRARAEACFRKAIEIARGQEARLLELRAAIDLARLWRDTASPNDPRALLEPILAAIEGGEDTRDVRNARVVLAEMA